MRVVLQRVAEARVRVGERVVGEIGAGLLLLVGFEPEEREAEVRWWAEKIAGLRIFPDEEGKMNLSVQEKQGAVLVVPNFTLQAEVSRGRRPSFSKAAPPGEAEAWLGFFVQALRDTGLEVRVGEFGAHMHVELVNDGPVTLVLEGAG
jgi:D-tyrosyl-tRNA(Tyr) deacylase